MKTFHAHYWWTGSYGAFQIYDAIVFAENNNAALGLVLMEYEHTQAKDWEFTEIEAKEPCVYRVSSNSD